MDDLISRQAAIDRAVSIPMFGRDVKMVAVSEIKNLPSAQPDLDEWCTDCKEYDQDKHCCPRWTRVIRQALKDAQPEIIRCKDCKHWDGVDTCDVIDAPVWDNDFCSMAERRSDE